MRRVLAIDYGRRRVGLAISDPLGLTAQGLPTLIIENTSEIIDWVIANREEWAMERIILGLPRSLSGNLGQMAEEVIEFSQLLEKKTRIPVELIDERLTSRQAHVAFAESGRKLKGHKEIIDKMAAMLLLQQYLEMNSEATDYENGE